MANITRLLNIPWKTYCPFYLHFFNFLPCWSDVQLFLQNLEVEQGWTFQLVKAVKHPPKVSFGLDNKTLS